VTVRHGAGLRRLLVKEGAPTVVSVRPGRDGSFRFSALAMPPESVAGPGSEALVEAGESTLRAALADFRLALGVDEDMTPFRDAFVADPLLGPAIAAGIESRSQRRADPWEALVWAITEQLIEYRRAAAIQRRVIRKWGLTVEPDGWTDGRTTPGRHARGPGRSGNRLSTVPSADVIAGVAPAELQACDLSAKRAIAMIRVAREVSRGRVDVREPADDRRLLAIPEIGPWTIACLALRGRGDPDALPAGDLGHVKLVGALAGLGRPAEVGEVERFYERYAPYRGLAGDFLLAYRGAAVRGPGNRARICAAARPVRRAA
jgi:DNA-3-methyladenine glycosylase II/AraC family transcriptional regulator of adaptative response / DNA-3-methyladenine glycosylase II